MIGRIVGKVAYKSPEYLIVDISGVGYKILVPASYLTEVKDNEDVTLFTHTYVKEDALSLYGFKTTKELVLFENLIDISGVGPKMAMGILSQHSVEEIERAVMEGDTEVFKSVSGIGKKNAQRIIVDMQSKIGKIAELDFVKDEKQNDLLEALKALGYSPGEVRGVVKEVNKEAKLEDQIKEALKLLSAA